MEDIRIRDEGGLTVVQMGDVRIWVEKDGLKKISAGEHRVIFEHPGGGSFGYLGGGGAGCESPKGVGGTGRSRIYEYDDLGRPIYGYISGMGLLSDPKDFRASCHE